jgi:enoyl-CoA hydratase
MQEDVHATLTEDDGILTVTMDRQAKLNAISPLMTATYWRALETLADRNDLRCLVITAKGKYFTAGIDLSDGPPFDPGEESDPSGRMGRYRRAYRKHHLLYDEFEAIEKPIILAVQGICLGAGLEMAMSCDFRFCTANAEFRLPEANLGLFPGSGGASRLTRLVGPAWGKWIAMAGVPVGAEQAKNIGLVHDVLPLETFMDDVYDFCRNRLMPIPMDVLGVAKLAIDIYGDVQDRTAQRHIDRMVTSTLQGTPERAALAGRFRKA